MFERLLYWLGFPLVRLYAWLMLRMDVLARVPMPDGPKIIAVNHPSTIDPFFVPLLSRCQMSLMLIDQVFRVPLLGLYLRWSGHVRVVPGQGEAVLERARRLLARGRTVVIFPEGLISPREGGFHRARSGVARLALSTGAPVIPVGIYLPRERRTTIITHAHDRRLVGEWYFHGPYHVTVGESMHFAGDTQDRDQVNAVAQTIMERIIDLAQQSALRQQTRLPVQTVPA
ncbi:MAG: 1-acyl-sn-glycerol-3-phosphate acyltransferase [Anaerolineae bacterium]|nr:1-acyl-sn-glycerol-3-phosphate acyltransferase [Anaerolineae bacterium]